MDLIIDPEFEEKIPPLTKEEYEQLEANILADGVLSPLIVWQGLIIDGHNRYKILKNHPEISYEVHEMDFASRFEAIAWICKNQLGRRNLTPEQKRYLIGKQYEAEKAIHGGSQFRDRDPETGQFTSSSQNEYSRSGERTVFQIANETNTSGSYVQRAEKYAQGVDAAEEAMPGLRQEILSGVIKPTTKDVIAVARASPEDRRELAEQLRDPRAPTRKRVSTKTADGTAEHSSEIKEDAERKAVELRPTLASAQAISDGMASSPDRKNRDTPVDIIIAELSDAVDSMIFRWDFCFSVNQPNASLEECQKQVRKLAAKGIEYLKSYQGGT